jgi:hypothetical protein
MAPTSAVDVLVRSGTASRLPEYTHDPSAPCSRKAAEAVGTEPQRVQAWPPFSESRR